MLGIAVGVIGIRIEEFWGLTPIEFSFISDSYYSKQEEVYQSSWEQTRMQVYYQYLAFPKKGRNPSYQRFKVQHLPFPWDKVAIDIDEEFQTMGEIIDQPITPNEWADRIKNMTAQGEAKLKDLEGRV